MKYFFFIVILFILSACKAFKTNVLDDSKEIIPNEFFALSSSEIQIKNDITYKNDISYSGYLFEIDTFSKDTLSLISYLNGKQEGLSKKYFSKNHIKELRYYSDGQKNGSQIAYWENGNRRFEFTAKADLYEGEMREWNSDGLLSHLAHFKNGQEDGEQKFWYDNGKIKANYVIINGKRYGLLGTKNCKNVSDSIFVVQ